MNDMNAYYPILRQATTLLLLFCLAGRAHSQLYTIYGIIGNQLAEIDPETGIASPIATLSGGYSDLSGLTYDPVLDKLFIVAHARSNPLLLSIERRSGQMTLVGAIDQVSPAIDFRLIEAMAYNPEDGKLYAAGYEQTVDQGWFFSRRLMQVDPLTGKATVVASITGTCHDEADALAFAFTSNVKYSLDVCQTTHSFTGLYSIDLSSGVSSLIGYNSLPGGATLGVHPQTGKLYAVAPGERKLYCVMTATGAVSLIGPTHAADSFNGNLLTEVVFAPARQQPPVAICRALFLEVGENCQTDVAPVAFDGGSTDANDDPLTFAVDVDSPYPLGTTPITLTVSDGERSSNCTTSITVRDTGLPLARCLHPQVLLDASGQAYITPDQIDGQSSDACGIASRTLSRTTFSCADLRPASRRRLSPVPVTMTVTDNNGNSSSCIARVEVVDATAPRAACRDLTITLPREGRYHLLPAEVDNGSWDACGLELTLSKTLFSCADLGANAVILTASDASGNSHSCQATVTIERGEAACGTSSSNLLPAPVIAAGEAVAALSLYPNPSLGDLTVQLPPTGAGTAQLTITDQLGRILWTRSLEAGQSSVALRLDAIRFPAGLYFVHWQGGSTQLLERLLLVSQ